ncbi:MULTISPECIES: hypothetical protein [Nostocales]|uniref:Uncharacterized protein n=3 Tax=Nostocales TaxID=1161 RepID=A0A8S9T1B2_9CYAN|nr:hypothetical protein [Tolypothrix bouteillei]KAF3885484.1 hypothetical protein DA73_0400008480 [Tolypothrix bouteillei VB521301]
MASHSFCTTTYVMVCDRALQLDARQREWFALKKFDRHWLAQSIANLLSR